MVFAAEDRARRASEDLDEEQTLSLSLSSLASPLLLGAAFDGFLRVMSRLGLFIDGDCCCERVEGRGVDRDDVTLFGRGILSRKTRIIPSRWGNWKKRVKTNRMKREMRASDGSKLESR